MTLNANHRIKGTMKLQYDATPRDNDQYEASTRDCVDASNFRFRGYPEGSMEKPRDLPPRAEDLTKVPQKNFQLSNYLDTKKAKAYELDVHAFQYGSEHLPLNKQATRPVRDPFNEKTSAELAKYRRQQVEADVEIQAFKAEKETKAKQREQEIKNDREMLMNYHPWGRPGAGAPVVQERGEAHKKHKITDDALHNSPGEPVPGQRQLMEEYGDFHGQFGRPGHGAPLKDENTGKVKTEIKGAADIRFVDTKGGRKVAETELRYQKPGMDKHSYFQELDQQAHEKKAGPSNDSRLANLRQELQTMVQSDPFGKPGAGAPNKSMSGHVMNAKKTTLSQDFYEQRRIDNKGFDGNKRTENVYDEEYGVFDPWGKGAVQPNRNKFGEPLRHKNADPNEGIFTKDKSNYEVSLNTDSKTGGGGAPVHGQDGQVQARFPVTLKRNDVGDTTVREDHPRQGPPVLPDDPELQIYDPFGKVGAGAPLRDAGGKVVSQVYGKIQNNGVGQPISSASAKQKKFQAQSYLHELRREMDEQKMNKEMDKNMGRVEAGDLTDLLRKGQVGKPRRDPVTGELLRQDLNMSDVTIERTDTRKLKSKDSMNYLTSLERAALERKRNNELDRLQERQQSKHHAVQMNEFWGRPGGGAPRATGTKKSKLDLIINSPGTMSPVYNPGRVAEDTRKSQEAGTKHYNRSTVQGNASNNYEMAKPLKREAKANYNLLTPYASEPGEVF